MKSRFNKQSGFTLIEVMVVVVILAILASIIVPKIMSSPEKARLVKAQQDVLAIQSAMDLYKLDNGFYPSTEQGLQALVTQPTTAPIPQSWKQGGYLSNMPVDPWGNPYHYTNDGGTIKIFSYGPDGVPGKGEIGNWQLNSQ